MEQHPGPPDSLPLPAPQQIRGRPSSDLSPSSSRTMRMVGWIDGLMNPTTDRWIGGQIMLIGRSHRHPPPLLGHARLSFGLAAIRASLRLRDTPRSTDARLLQKAGLCSDGHVLTEQRRTSAPSRGSTLLNVAPLRRGMCRVSRFGTDENNAPMIPVGHRNEFALPLQVPAPRRRVHREGWFCCIFRAIREACFMASLMSGPGAHRLVAFIMNCRARTMG
jgi:hypothetical protein